MPDIEPEKIRTMAEDIQRIKEEELKREKEKILGLKKEPEEKMKREKEEVKEEVSFEKEEKPVFKGRFKEKEREDLEKRKAEIEREFTLLAEKKLPIEKEKGKFLEEISFLEQSLQPILGKEKEVEEKEKEIQEREKLTIPEERAKVERERWEVEKERRKIEEERWQVEEKIELVKAKLRDCDFRYQEILKREEELKKEKEEIQKKEEFFDWQEKKIDWEEKLKEIFRKKEPISASAITLARQKAEVREALVKITLRENELERKLALIEEKEKTAKIPSQRREIEKERWQTEDEREKTEEERWRLEAEKNKLEAQEKEMELKLKEISADEERVKREIEKINEKLKEYRFFGPEEGGEEIKKKVKFEEPKKEEIVKREIPIPKEVKKIEEVKPPPEKEEFDREEWRRELLERLKAREKKEAVVPEKVAKPEIPTMKKPEVMKKLERPVEAPPTWPERREVLPEERKRVFPFKNFFKIGIAIFFLLFFSSFLYWFFSRPEKPLPTPTPSPILSPSPVEIAPPQPLIPIEEKIILEVEEINQIPETLRALKERKLEKGKSFQVLIKNTEENRWVLLEEIALSFGLNLPDEFWKNVSREYTLGISQEKEGKRPFIVLKFEDKEELEKILKKFEPAMPDVFWTVWGKEISPAMTYFKPIRYRGINFRYQNFTDDYFGICYTILGDFLIFTTSSKTMIRFIDWLVFAE